MRYKLIILFLMAASFAYAQTVIPLYEGPIPGAIAAPSYIENTRTNNGLRFIDRVSSPTLAVYVPKTPNGAAVIICPGGGYQTLAIDHEGDALAKRFNEFGITAFVLKYRLPSDLIMKDKSMGPLQDAQQAFLMVRKNAKKWKLDPKKIGIVGSSAGGHLAASAGTHFNQVYVPNEQGLSVRPDFMVLLYPVISFGGVAHTGSAKNLLGPAMAPEKIQFFSNETQVTEQTPPTFLVHAGDDKVVLVKNSILFYDALIAKGVNTEMHLYRAGGHGFGLNNKTNTDDWFLRLMNWLKDSKLI